MSKIRFYSCFFVAFALISIAVKEQIPTDKLVAYYPFDGNAKDMSGNGNDGTVSGATLTTDRFGNANSAYSFDGVNDYIKVADAPSLRIGNSSSPGFTISVWINISGFQSRSCVLSKRYDTYNAPYNSYQIGVSSEYLNYGTTPYWEASSYHGIIKGTHHPDKDKWVHLVELYDGDSLYLFVNTKLECKSAASGSVGYNSMDLLIGSAALLPSQYMMGKIDDLRIYDKALSSSDRDKLYQEGYDKVTITKEPTDVIAEPGDQATFSVSATGTMVNYQWQVETNGVFQNLAIGCPYSVYPKTLVIDPISKKMFGSKYRVIAYNYGSSDTSETVTLIRDSSSMPVYDTIRVTDTTMVYDTTHITTYDTTVIQILETHHIDVYDTTHVVVTDTAHVTIYDTVYTSVTDTLIIDAVLSTGPNPTKNTLKVYPNPAKDHLYIDNGNYSLMNYYSIEVLNSLGQRVYHDFIDTQKMEIDLSTWGGPGLYVLLLNDKQNKPIEVRKIVLQ